jgi:hypothetical protein
MEYDVDYELIPGTKDHWHIRLKTGPYIETVFFFDKITLNDDEETLSFNVELVYSPRDDAWVPFEDLEWQALAGDVLQSLLKFTLDAEEKEKETS